MECRRLLAIVPFSAHTIAPTSDQPVSALAADMDSDGDLDVLSASIGDGTIAWYENTDGLGGYGPGQLVTIDVDILAAVDVADLDGDGDLDVLSVSRGDDTLAWYENQNALGSFGTQQIISDAIVGARSAEAVDIDGDGDQDVLSGNWWFENVDGLGSFLPRELPILFPVSSIAVHAADMDNDGDDDILASMGTEIHLYENVDGTGTFRFRESMQGFRGRANPLRTADIDGDGDLDVLAGTAVDLVWLENPDGDQVLGTKMVIDQALHDAPAYPTDVDGDGDADVVSAFRARQTVVWYENVDGGGVFGRQRILATGTDAAAVVAADLDADGDNDIFWAAYQDSMVAWSENRDGLGAFGPTRPISIASNDSSTIFLADMDGDGDGDLVSPPSRDGRISWYENSDGQGDFSRQPHVITSDVKDLRSVVVGDLDGDGDIDVIAAQRNQIIRYDNMNGRGDFGPGQMVVPDAVGVRSVFLADLDGDEDMDLIWSWFVPGNPWTGQIIWHQNTDGNGNFGARRVIDANAGVVPWVRAADLDADGDLDLVYSSSHTSLPQGGGLLWYENTDARGTFATGHIIEHLSATEVWPVDLDVDGDLDLISVDGGNDTIRIHENVDGTGAFSPPRFLRLDDYATFSLTRISLADVDRDGDVDVLSVHNTGSWGRVTWFDNLDGYGRTWHEQRISDLPGASDVVGADLSGDGDIDVVVAADSYLRRPSKIVWYRNDSSRVLPRFQNRLPIRAGPTRPSVVEIADFDGDGDNDVITGSSTDEIIWYENADGLGGFAERQVITRTRNHLTSVHAADFDGDGDLDVMSTAKDYSLTPQSRITVAWYENQDGKGNFEQTHIVDESNSLPQSARLADLDGDGDVDVVVELWTNRRGESSEVVWYENTDGLGNFGPRQVIVSQPDTLLSIDAADLDADGDDDVVAIWSAGDLRWYENRDGAGTIWVSHEAVAGLLAFVPTSIHATDLDRDGDVDIVSGFFAENTIAWYENHDGNGSFESRHVIDADTHYPKSIRTADVDTDGDPDLIVATSDAKIVWFENLDGTTRFGPQQVISTHGSQAEQVGVADLDGDGDLDVVAPVVADLVWFENLTIPLHVRQPGDANEDLQFDQLDIRQVLQAGKYSTRQPATWNEGDFNGDGAFDRLDLVMALQTGNYLQGPYTTRTLPRTGASNAHIALSNREDERVHPNSCRITLGALEPDEPGFC